MKFHVNVIEVVSKDYGMGFVLELNRKGGKIVVCFKNGIREFDFVKDFEKENLKSDNNFLKYELKKAIELGECIDYMINRLWVEEAIKDNDLTEEVVNILNKKYLKKKRKNEKKGDEPENIRKMRVIFDDEKRYRAA